MYHPWDQVQSQRGTGSTHSTFKSSARRRCHPSVQQLQAAPVMGWELCVAKQPAPDRRAKAHLGGFEKPEKVSPSSTQAGYQEEFLLNKGC